MTSSTPSTSGGNGNGSGNSSDSNFTALVDATQVLSSEYFRTELRQEMEVAREATKEFIAREFAAEERRVRSLLDGCWARFGLHFINEQVNLAFNRMAVHLESANSRIFRELLNTDGVGANFMKDMATEVKALLEEKAKQKGKGKGKTAVKTATKRPPAVVVKTEDEGHAVPVLIAAPSAAPAGADQHAEPPRKRGRPRKVARKPGRPRKAVIAAATAAAVEAEAHSEDRRAAERQIKVEERSLRLARRDAFRHGQQG